MKNIIAQKFQNISNIFNQDKYKTPESFNESMAKSYGDVTTFHGASVEFTKKMINSLNSHGVTEEKKWKTFPNNVLANELLSIGQSISSDHAIRKSMLASADMLQVQAHHEFQYETEIETNVLKPLLDSITSLYEAILAEISAINTTQRDLNTAKERQHKHLYESASSKYAEDEKLVENLQNDLAKKIDFVTTKLYRHEANRNQIAHCLLEMMQCKRRFLENSLKSLDEKMPEFGSLVESSTIANSFKVPLEVHLAQTGREISYVIETCVQLLDKPKILQTEGIFRVSATKSRIELLKEVLNTPNNPKDLISFDKFDVHTITGALKLYLRELPVPLFHPDQLSKWLEAEAKMQQDQYEAAYQIIFQCLRAMHPDYKANLAFLVRFLNRVLYHEADSKMNARNLMLVIAPNLSFPDSSTEIDIEKLKGSINITLGNSLNHVFEALIQYSDNLLAEVPEPRLGAIPPEEEAAYQFNIEYKQKLRKSQIEAQAPPPRPAPVIISRRTGSDENLLNEPIAGGSTTTTRIIAKDSASVQTKSNPENSVLIIKKRFQHEEVSQSNKSEQSRVTRVAKSNSTYNSTSGTLD